MEECIDELKEVFHDMSYALEKGHGDKAFKLLIRLVLDKYPLNIRVEACQNIMAELMQKEAATNHREEN